MTTSYAGCQSIVHLVHVLNSGMRGYVNGSISHTHLPVMHRLLILMLTMIELSSLLLNA
jgi:hypothetical protein